MKRLLPFLLVLLYASQANAQSGSGTASFNASGVFSENFDGFPSASCPCTVAAPGWYVADGVDDKWALNSGSSTTGDLYVLGTTTEKAMGGLHSSTASPVWGVKINNNTGTTITSLRIQFNGEDWRVVNRGSADQLDFQYSVSASASVTDAAASANWTDVNALDYRTLPLNSGATTTTNAANGVLGMDYTITGLSIPAGSNIFLRWIDSDVTGSDDAAGIDDLIVTANPSCGGGTTYAAQSFEGGSLSSCWSSSGMGISTTNPVFETGSGRTSGTTAAVPSGADQLKADVSTTGLYEDLSSPTTNTFSWEFTVRTDLGGQAISTANLWGYFLYNNQQNYISTVSNTGYAVGVNLGSASDATIKLYKLNGQRWDAAGITTLITSGYIYPGTASTQTDRNVTIKVVRTGNSSSASWELFINGVSQGTATDASPVLSKSSFFTSGFFNAHNANRSFEIDNILTYNGTRPCSLSAPSICNVLPLRLVSFNGNRINTGNRLAWEVADVLNTQYFEIEYSNNGTDFRSIGKENFIQGKNQYSFIHSGGHSLSYYRLKITDKDGTFIYSDIVRLNNTPQLSFSIAPNPAATSIIVRFDAVQTGSLIIYSATGKEVWNQKLYAQSSATIDIQALSAGSYIVKINDDNGHKLNGRFVKL